MANDFGSNFLRGFQPNFANNFDTSFRYGLNQKEQERQRKEQEKAQQEQMGILNQLVSGKLQSGSYRGKFAPLDMSLNQQDQTNLVGRASDDTLQRYKILSEMNTPKMQKVDYEEWDGNKYLKNPDGSVDFTKPVTQKEEKPDFVETDYVGNKQVRREFYKQEDGSVKTVDIPTGFLKDTRTTRSDENGKEYQDLSKDYVKELDQRVDRFITARDMKFAADQTKDGIPYSDPLTGMKYTITSETANGMVESGKNQLQNYLNTQGNASNKQYWKERNIEAWDAIQKEGKGDHGVTTWKYIEEDRTKGEISQADFLEARYRFIAKWGYDPYQKLRINK